MFSLVIGVALLAALAAAWLTQPVELKLMFGVLAAGLGLFGLRVASQARSRARIYRLLERRFASRGIAIDDLRRFMGELCLVAQAFMLLARWRRLDVWADAVRRFRGEGVLFLAHPTEPIEDELNFPENAIERPMDS